MKAKLQVVTKGSIQGAWFQDQQYSLGLVDQNNQQYICLHNLIRGDILPSIAIYIHNNEPMVQVPIKDKSMEPIYMKLEDLIEIVRDKGSLDSNDD